MLPSLALPSEWIKKSDCLTHFCFGDDPRVEIIREVTVAAILPTANPRLIAQMQCPIIMNRRKCSSLALMSSVIRLINSEKSGIGLLDSKGSGDPPTPPPKPFELTGGVAGSVATAAGGLVQAQAVHTKKRAVSLLATVLFVWEYCHLDRG